MPRRNSITSAKEAEVTKEEALADQREREKTEENLKPFKKEIRRTIRKNPSVESLDEIFSDELPEWIPEDELNEYMWGIITLEQEMRGKGHRLPEEDPVEETHAHNERHCGRRALLE